MLESLFGYDSENDEYIDCIGTDFEWSTTGDSITIEINPNAEWSDGVALTAEDVAYSFELAGKQSRYATDMGLRYESFNVVDDTTVRFDIKPGYEFSRQVTLAIRQNMPIVAKHVWTEISDDYANEDGDLSTYQWDWFDSDTPDDWKVISGPYAPVYRDATETTLALQYRGDDWWGQDILYKDVPNYSDEQRTTAGEKGGIPKYIAETTFGANAEQDLAFIRGDIDLFAGYYANIWEVWQDADEGDPESYVTTWFGHSAPYQLAASAMMNLAPNHMKGVLGVPEFRQALSWAIDYAPIPDAAASGYWMQGVPGWLHPNSNLQKPYYDASITTTYQKSLDVDKAVALLQGIPGMSGNVDDGWTYNGKAVGPYTAVTPTGWTDATAWTTMSTDDIRENLGIDIQVQEGDFGNVYQADIADDSFDFAMACCGNRLADPPERFLDYLRGESLWNKNITNWDSALAEEFNDKWNELDAATEAVYASNLDRMQEILAIEVPEIVGFVNGYWYCVSEWQWEGWASKANNFQQIITTWTDDQFAIKTRLWMNLVSTGRKANEPVIPFAGLELMVALGVISITAITALRLRKKR
jgi:peptide/nickel transport system substrate-binding protein